jgi:hypothetical protein
MTDSKSKDWINPHQWIVDLGCKIFYGVADRSIDELEVADMILELIEAAELRGRIAGLREAAKIIDRPPIPRANYGQPATGLFTPEVRKILDHVRELEASPLANPPQIK